MEKQKSDFIRTGPHYQEGNSPEQFQLRPTETVQGREECFPYQ
jgi:hypothetical protein